MNDFNSIRNEQIARLASALRRLAGATKGVELHYGLAHGAMVVGTLAQSVGCTPIGMKEAAALVHAGMLMLGNFDAPEPMKTPLLRVFGLLHTRFITESLVLINAQAEDVQSAIDEIDTHVAFYEAQRLENDIRQSDSGRSWPIRPFGVPCDTDRGCRMSYGEGTRDDPDRCVFCNGLFERDAKWPFAYEKKAA